MMNTPSTADVRTWAQGNGFEVGERGRLPDEVHAAYRRAHTRTSSRTKSSAPTRKTTTLAGTTPARRTAAPAKATSPRKQSAAKPAVERPAKTQPLDGGLAARVSRLETQVAELTSRLDTPATATTTRRRSARGGK